MSDELMQSTHSLEIVTVLFGGISTLRDTLPTWINAVAGTDVGLRFIDNSPTPEAGRLIAKLTEDASVTVTYRHDPTNPGFAASANRAIRESSAQWAFLVNPDVYLTSDAVEAVVRYASSAVGDAPAAISICTGGQLTSGVELSWYGYFGDRRVPARRSCIGPSGGAAVFPVGQFVNNSWYFDEDLFAWGEDAGLAIRLFAAGVRTAELDLGLKHVGGHSVASPSGQRLKARLLARNRLVVLRRDFSAPFRFTVGSLMLMVMVANGIRKARNGTAIPHFKGMVEAARLQKVGNSDRPRMGLVEFLRYVRSQPRASQ